jgi:hypothetical protein
MQSTNHEEREPSLHESVRRLEDRVNQLETALSVLQSSLYLKAREQQKAAESFCHAIDSNADSRSGVAAPDHASYSRGATTGASASPMSSQDGLIGGDNRTRSENHGRNPSAPLIQPVIGAGYAPGRAPPTRDSDLQDANSPNRVLRPTGPAAPAAGSVMDLIQPLFNQVARLTSVWTATPPSGHKDRSEARMTSFASALRASGIPADGSGIELSIDYRALYITLARVGTITIVAPPQPRISTDMPLVNILFTDGTTNSPMSFGVDYLVTRLPVILSRVQSSADIHPGLQIIPGIVMRYSNQ